MTNRHTPRLLAGQQVEQVPTGHAGLTALVIGFAIYQIGMWRRYQNAVGSRATFADFQVWKRQVRALVKAQPRISPRRAIIYAIGAVVLLLMAHIPVVGFIFAIGAIVAIVLAIRNFRHRRVPDDQLHQLSAERLLRPPP